MTLSKKAEFNLARIIIILSIFFGPISQIQYTKSHPVLKNIFIGFYAMLARRPTRSCDFKVINKMLISDTIPSVNMPWNHGGIPWNTAMEYSDGIIK